MRAYSSFLLTLCALALATTARAEDQMPWQVNVETAQQLAAKTNRLVLIHFWAPWCKPCMRLEKEVFSRADTAKSLEANFVFVKVNADEAPGTTRSFGVSSLPTDVIVTPQGRLVSQFQSPPTATQYITQLNQAAAGHRELARRNAPPAAPAAAAASPAPQTVVAPVAAPPAPAAASPAPAPVTSAAMPTDPNVVAAAAAPTDRYAEYYRQQQLAQAGSPNAPAAAPAVPPQSPAIQQPAAVAQPPEAAPQAATAPTADPSMQVPVAQSAPPTAQPPVAAQSHPIAQPQPGAQTPMAAQASPGGAGYPPQEAYNAHAAYQPGAQSPQLPPGCPPAALDGNCPVTLMERRQWATGNRAWGAIHRGRTYLFVGPDEKEKFLANPDFYSPVLAGNDPVLALDNQMLVPGRREYGFFGPDNRVYLFADEASLKRFEANPRRYAAEVVQARR